MAVATDQIAVGHGAAVLIATGADVTIRNAGASSMFLGPAAVTASTGFELVPGASITTDAAFGAGDDVYGICGPGRASRADTLRAA